MQQHAQHFIEPAGPCGRRSSAFDDDDGLTAGEVRVAAGKLRKFRQAAAIEGFMALGQFARDAGATRGAAGLSQIREARGETVRRLVEHERARLRGKFGQSPPPRRGARRQETFEAEPVAGESSGRQCGDRGTGPGHRRNHDSGRQRGAQQLITRIADERRTGIADQRDVLTASHPLDELDRAGTLIVFVQRQQRALQTQFPQQLSAVSGVFGGDDAGTREYFARSRRNVPHVADRRRHHVKHARLRHYNALPDCNDRRQGPSPMQANVSATRTLLAVCALVALGAGCQPGLGRAGGSGAQVERAGRQASQGDHPAAARSFAAAARAASPSQANALWLSAAAEWLAAGDIMAAEAAIGMLGPPVSAADAEERVRIEAEIALSRGQIQRAVGLLREIPDSGDPAALATRARIQFSTGRVPDAVASLVGRDRLLSGAAARQENQRMIVDGIREALGRGADSRVPAGADPLIAGWLELGRILADARSGALGVQRRIQTWRSRYPAHPASEALWRDLVGSQMTSGGLAQQVALLLPLSGHTEAAGVAVRDGFLGAYYDQDAALRPRLRIYDVATRDAASAYLQALADGSDFVVGPLTREEVAGLASLADRRATTLALNFLPDGVAVPDRFYQFALSPEDEARQVAHRVVADGHPSGVTLVPQSDWGRRVQAAFAAELAAAGGRVADQADYAPATADFNELLRRLLRTTGERGSAPRADAQFIFVAAQPVHGSLIRTQLRFNYAGSLPMYATSDIHDPTGNGNLDLDGVIFPDMPWVLDRDGPAATAREAAGRAWPERAARPSRLHAFGYDAFRLVGELQRLRGKTASPLPGLTGRLTVDNEGRVRRELDWAQIVDGRAAPLPPAGAAVQSP